jgi:hypothetical protein
MTANELLSVHAATKWLLARGFRAMTRHRVYQAIVNRELRIAGVASGSANRMVFIRLDDLEDYAATLSKSATISDRPSGDATL